MTREDIKALKDVNTLARLSETDAIRGRLWRNGSRLGTVVDIMLDLTTDQRDWLMGQVPKGGSIGDVLLMIARDAYLDEME